MSDGIEQCDQLIEVGERIKALAYLLEGLNVDIGKPPNHWRKKARRRSRGVLSGLKATFKVMGGCFHIRLFFALSAPKCRPIDQLIDNAALSGNQRGHQKKRKPA